MDNCSHPAAKEHVPMDRIPLESLIEEIKSLSVDNQRQLLLWLATVLSEKRALTPQVERQLASVLDGSLSVPPPMSEAKWEALRQRKPIPFEGKPLSETIIEERR